MKPEDATNPAGAVDARIARLLHLSVGGGAPLTSVARRLGRDMRIHTLIKTPILATMLLAFSIVSRASDTDGRVCVQKIPSGPSSSWNANDPGASERSMFSARIDDLPAINVTTNSSGVFTNLSLAKKHLVAIRVDGKPLTSFRFSFDGRAPHLRLWYNEFYGTWSLSDVRAGEKCACSSSTPSNKGAAANRRPPLQSDGLDNLSAILAADRVLPAAVAELGR